MKKPLIGTLGAIALVAITYYVAYDNGFDAGKEHGHDNCVDNVRPCILKAENIEDADRCLFGGRGIRP